MDIKSNLSMPFIEFDELNSGDCFVWFDQGELGTEIYMRLNDMDVIENAYVNLKTGEVNSLEPIYGDSLVLLVKLNATAELSND